MKLRNTLNTPFPLGKTGKLTILLMLVLLGAGCAGQSEITQAFNTINAISAVRNGLQPIYTEVVRQRPDLAEEIENFDEEFHDAIVSAYGALILAQSGDGSIADYRAKINALVVILDRYKVEERVPALKPGIELVKRLLGVFV